jgi:magnesium-transporting ATPase (P-type)
MTKLIVGVWIYLCGILGSAITAGFLSQMLRTFPASQLEAYGPRVPEVARSYAALVVGAPTVLGAVSALSVAIGIYLWRSRRPRDTRLFAAAVISALNLFLAMFFTMILLLAYFYVPKIANAH